MSCVDDERKRWTIEKTRCVPEIQGCNREAEEH